MDSRLDAITAKALNLEPLSDSDALYIANDARLPALLDAASEVRERHKGSTADFCAIVSAKTGACPENCSYCAQSARAKTDITVSGLMPLAEIRKRAQASKTSGARRFCIVTSGKAATCAELGRIGEMVAAVREEGLLPCATLGLLNEGELRLLKIAGLQRYHHNLETSRRFFPEICSTHTYDQKLVTIRAAQKAGLEVCSGGIFGLGEDWEDRISMARELSSLNIDSVPVNFLVPIKGTPLESAETLPPLEALRVISLMRMMLPDRQIRVCGGRLQTLGQLNSMVFLAGADGLLTGDCLTVAGCRPDDDIRLASAFGLRV